MRAGDRLTGIDLGYRRADSTPPEKPVAGAPCYTPTTQNNHDERVTHPAPGDTTRTQTERNQYDSDALPLFTRSQAVHISIMRCHNHRIGMSTVPDIPNDEYPPQKALLAHQSPAITTAAQAQGHTIRNRGYTQRRYTKKQHAETPTTPVRDYRRHIPWSVILNPVIHPTRQHSAPAPAPSANAGAYGTHKDATLTRDDEAAGRRAATPHRDKTQARQHSCRRECSSATPLALNTHPVKRERHHP